jgi:hypothetical protein
MDKAAKRKLYFRLETLLNLQFNKSQVIRLGAIFLL